MAISNWKIFVFYLFVIPVAVVWDILYGTVDLLHKGMTWVDEKGDDLLLDLKDRIEGSP